MSGNNQEQNCWYILAVAILSSGMVLLGLESEHEPKWICQHTSECYAALRERKYAVEIDISTRQWSNA